jgi:hypothetical protein
MVEFRAFQAQALILQAVPMISVVEDVAHPHILLSGFVEPDSLPGSVEVYPLQIKVLRIDHISVSCHIESVS